MIAWKKLPCGCRPELGEHCETCEPDGRRPVDDGQLQIALERAVEDGSRSVEMLRRHPIGLAPLAVRFAEFHRDNPLVYDRLVKLARRGRNAGAVKLGIGQLFEVLRWRCRARRRARPGACSVPQW